MDGLISIYKEQGFTSHDAVAKLRGIVHQRKIGHTGTLDPLAEGVLPVCLGSATRACEYLTDHEKEYTAVMKLGEVTDTQDATGTVTETHPVVCTEEEIRLAASHFQGEIGQIPPMYSAVWVDGRRLYDLARKGKTVERPARKILVSRMEVTKIRLPYVTLQITCSRGTYVRTLCHDIGQELGCGAVMTSLLRTRVGNFTLQESRTLGEIEQIRDRGQLDEILLNTDRIFLGLPAFTVTGDDVRLVKNGNPVSMAYLGRLRQPPEGETGIICFPGKTCFRVYLEDGSFVAIYRTDEKRHLLVPEKMFLR